MRVEGEEMHPIFRHGDVKHDWLAVQRIADVEQVCLGRAARADGRQHLPESLRIRFA